MRSWDAPSLKPSKESLGENKKIEGRGDIPHLIDLKPLLSTLYLGREGNNHMKHMSRRKFVRNTFLMGAGIMASEALIPVNHWAKGSEKKKTPLLLLPPFLGKPTKTSISMNIVAGEKTISFYIKYRKKVGSKKSGWLQTPVFTIEAFSPKEITFESLTPSTIYKYEIHARLAEDDKFKQVADETFRTKPSGTPSFSFAMFSDSHITRFKKERDQILNQIGASIRVRKPDFAFMLGDNIQTLAGVMIEKRSGPILYANLRHALGRLPSSVPVFNVIGNWEGENGWYPPKERGWAREARRAFIPTPDPNTYPEGGGQAGDYYGFTWGDVLLLALNVTGYTLLDHSLPYPIGKPDDWTVGDEQKSWLYKQLSTSNARWKLLLIHHTVGGNGGDDAASRYGRGGGRAAKIGEQAKIHEWMREFGVQALFYGHDHVFTDIPVDGIHYVCVGSAGAPWKFDRTRTGYQKYYTPFGYTWVDVKERKLTISFLNQNILVPEGEVIHRFDIPKI
jgi:3',5'-cyclic AMP phosphodiesterase CpdA